ncbi:MAG: DUF1700 domain-containing protein [Bacillota bacterium]|nr:MAG: DUF1700 domain-containing protein [Bacillota bacterium]
MKAKYLEALKNKLIEFQASKEDINDILKDYGQLYDDMLETGRTDEEIYKLLGEPNHVAYELIDTLRIKRKKDVRNKFIALMPFVSVITFMAIGLSTDIWHPTWLVFLSIPVMAIILSTKVKEMLIALMPFASTVTFILLGTYANLWNPGWLVFLSIPMMALIQDYKNWKSLVSFISFAVAIAFYLYVGYTYNRWDYAALGFILPVVTGLVIGETKFIWNFPKDPKERRGALVMLSVIILATAGFLALGLLLDGWVYAWQTFLLIPISAILFFDKKFRLTPLMPFIAVIIFFNLGFFAGLWTISWMAFLLIPVTAIIENA